MDLYSTPKSKLQDLSKSFMLVYELWRENICEKTMNFIRCGLQKNSLKKNKNDIVIVPEFKDANSVFLAMCAKIKKEEKETVEHKEP